MSYEVELRKSLFLPVGSGGWADPPFSMDPLDEDSLADINIAADVLAVVTSREKRIKVLINIFKLGYNRGGQAILRRIDEKGKYRTR